MAAVRRGGFERLLYGVDREGRRGASFVITGEGAMRFGVRLSAQLSAHGAGGEELVTVGWSGRGSGVAPGEGAYVCAVGQVRSQRG